MSENTNKSDDSMDDLKDIRDLYIASQQEESPTKLDSVILKAAHGAADNRAKSRKRLRIFDPPVAVAATILLSVGLVTLVMKDVDKTTLPPSLKTYPLTESSNKEKQRPVTAAYEDILSRRDKSEQSISADVAGIAASPALDSIDTHEQEKIISAQEAISNSDLAEPAPAPVLDAQTETATAAEIAQTAIPAPTSSAPQPIPLPAKSESLAEKKQASYAREAAVQRKQVEQLKLRDELQREIQEEEAQLALQTQAKTRQLEKKHGLPRKSVGAAAMAPALSEPVIDEDDVEEKEYLADSSAARLTSGFLAPVQRVLHNKGDVRTVTGKLEVWYDENHRWVNAARFFDLELTRLNGPTYGKTREYPAYETVEEWHTLVEILPDGRECPMVFYHERWRRLADVLDLDQRLRDYDGCADVLKPKE